MVISGFPPRDGGGGGGGGGGDVVVSSFLHPKIARANITVKQSFLIGRNYKLDSPYKMLQKSNKNLT
jgi:hypothetical protein